MKQFPSSTAAPFFILTFGLAQLSLGRAIGEKKYPFNRQVSKVYCKHSHPPVNESFAALALTPFAVSEQLSDVNVMLSYTLVIG